jgi:hypothetical protein
MQVFFRKNIHHQQFLKRKSASSTEVPEGRSRRRSKTHRRSNAASGAAARRAASLRRARVPPDVETIESETFEDSSMNVEALDQQGPSAQTSAELEHTAPNDENSASSLLPSSRAAISPSGNVASRDISAVATLAPSADINVTGLHERNSATSSSSHIGQANLARHADSRRQTRDVRTPRPAPASLVSEEAFSSVRYYIVRSRRPKTSEMWFPAGTFSGKTLALLKAESNLEVDEDAGDIRFVLSEIQTGDSVACTVALKSEYCFKEMKNGFTDFIREHLSERRGLVSFRMEIEQLASGAISSEETSDYMPENWIFDSNSRNGI